MNQDISFELQVLRRGRWATDGIYEGREDALRDARIAQARHIAVRVVADNFDPDRGRFVSKTIYRHQPEELSSGAWTPQPKPAEAVPGHRMARSMPRDVPLHEDPLVQVALGLVAAATAVLAGIGILIWLDLV